MIKFLICLAPIVLSFLFVLSKDDLLLQTVLILLPVGSLLSAFFAAQAVTRESEASDGIKALLAIITFLVVGVAYLAIGVYGGCSLMGGDFS